MEKWKSERYRFVPDVHEATNSLHRARNLYDMREVIEGLGAEHADLWGLIHENVREAYAVLCRLLDVREVPQARAHEDPELCSSWYDGCHCTPETCKNLSTLLDEAEKKLQAHGEKLERIRTCVQESIDAWEGSEHPDSLLPWLVAFKRDILGVEE